MARVRLTPDPSVSVSDLMKAFETFFNHEGMWDLRKLLLEHGRCPKSWKTSPDASYLSGHMAALCTQLFRVCPNGVLSSKKIKQSLEKLQTEKKKRLNHSSTCDPDFWDSVDQEAGS